MTMREANILDKHMSSTQSKIGSTHGLHTHGLHARQALTLDEPTEVSVRCIAVLIEV